jgi:UDP-glucose 4-epimerase
MASRASTSGLRVLLIGGAGFVGSNLAHALARDGAEVTVMDAMLEGYGGNLANLEGTARPVAFVKGDARDGEAVALQVRGKDAIVNLFAQVSHSRGLQEPFLDLDLNARANLVVLEEVRKHADGAAVLFCGTRGQTGEPKRMPVDEDHPDDPTDMNGINKLAAEKYHRLYHRVHGLRTASLRLGNTYGPRHQMKHGQYGVLNWFVRRALDGATIELFGGGAQTRDYTFVEDAAEAFRLGLFKLPLRGEHYLIGSPFEASLAEVARMVVAAAGSGAIVEKPYPPGVREIEVSRYRTDFSRFASATGWAPSVPLDTGIARTVQFYRERLANYR